ncbi:MAG: ATP-binding protein [Myxococcota bacterium]
MIQRTLEPTVRELAGMYPVVTVTGPRQSGKTTLCRRVFPDKAYVSLEALDMRQYARDDPRGFLAEHRDGAILDEVQHVPELLSYLQGVVDEDPTPGRFVLTGSQHFGLAQGVSQSLAGRTAVLHLLPPGLEELRRFPGGLDDLLTTLWTGAYPAIHERGIPADRWLTDYVTTYVQRDVRQVVHVSDLETFTTFVRLCAGRTGQILNLSALGGDCGVSHNTARSWLSVLETSFLLMRLPAWHRTRRKQLTKSPKIHLLDSGLACNLLGIRSPEELRHHPLRGAIFESWVVSEVYKHHVHRGARPSLFHLRSRRGRELDLLVERGRTMDLVEVKSGATVQRSFFRDLQRAASLLDEDDRWEGLRRVLVYGGDQRQSRSETTVLPWDQVDAWPWSEGP